MIERFLALLAKALGWKEPKMPPVAPKTTPTSPVTPQPVPMPEPAPVNVDTLLPWNTTDSLSHENYHNVRVLCDLKGLHAIPSPHNPGFTLKDELTATVWGESEFKVHVIHPNYVFKKTLDANGNPVLDANGQPVLHRVLSTTDYGIAQWNDWFHGKEITPDQAVNDPEMAINLMADYFLAGRQDQWCAHSNGSYKQYLGRKL